MFNSWAHIGCTIGWRYYRTSTFQPRFDAKKPLWLIGYESSPMRLRNARWRHFQPSRRRLSRNIPFPLYLSFQNLRFFWFTPLDVCESINISCVELKNKSEQAFFRGENKSPNKAFVKWNFRDYKRSTQNTKMTLFEPSYQ